MINMALAPMSSLVLHACAGAVFGAIVGYGYFTALWWNVLLIDRGVTGRALLLFVARVATLGLAMFILVHFGALVLLSGAAGLLAARRVLIRRIGGQS